MTNTDIFDETNHENIFRKVLTGCAGLFYTRIKASFIKADGSKADIDVPISIEGADKQWFIDTFESAYAMDCPIDKINGSYTGTPAGVLKPKSYSIETEESLNDNIPVYLENGKMEKTRGRVKLVPIEISFDLIIRASNLNQSFNIAEKMIDIFDDNMLFHFSHHGIDKLNCVVSKEDSIGLERKVPISFGEAKESIKTEYAFKAAFYYPKINRFVSYPTSIKTEKTNFNAK